MGGEAWEPLSSGFMARLPVSVIIPVRDDPLIFQAVDAVLGQEGCQSPLELIVVDNGSKPAFRRSLAELDPAVTVLDEPLQGAAAARNLGIDHAGGEFIFFTDADCTPLPDWVAEGLRGFEKTGADLLSGGRLWEVTTRHQRLVHAANGYAARRKPKTNGGKAAAPAAPFVDTANVAVRRRVFDRVRFDIALLRGQDIAFGMDAVMAGFVLVDWPAMRVRIRPDEALRLRVAKEVMGGWGIADRTLRRTRASGGQVRPPASARRLRHLPGHQVLAGAGILLLVAAAGTLDLAARFLPLGWLVAPAGRLAAVSRRSGRIARHLGVPPLSPAELARGRMRVPTGHRRRRRS